MKMPKFKINHKKIPEETINKTHLILFSIGLMCWMFLYIQMDESRIFCKHRLEEVENHNAWFVENLPLLQEEWENFGTAHNQAEESLIKYNPEFWRCNAPKQDNILTWDKSFPTAIFHKDGTISVGRN